jgi:hypothetical protein
LDRLKSEPIPHVSTINRPRAVGEFASVVLHGTCDGEQCVGDAVIATMRLQKVFQRAVECRVIGNVDPFDWSEHPIEKHREPGIRRADVAEQDGFT